MAQSSGQRSARRKAKAKGLRVVDGPDPCGLVVGGVLYRSSVTLRTSHKLTALQRLRVLLNGVVVIECAALVERDTGRQHATPAKFATLPLARWIARLLRIGGGNEQ